MKVKKFFDRLKEKWNRMSKKERLLIILEALAVFGLGFTHAILTILISKLLGG